LGYILHLKRNEPGAIAAYRESIRIDRYFALAHADLGDALRAIGDWDGAIAAFREAVRLTPNSVRDHLKLVSALYHQGYVVETLEEYREVIRLDPKHVEAHSQLAWLRATYPDAKFRDGKEAVKLATKATVLLSKNWDHLDTLAAAFAEAGSFERAVGAQQEAINRLKAQRSPDPRLLDDFNRRLKLFQDRKPYREPPPTPSAPPPRPASR
jgi:tetratricopeptide (TPR) repeat protein